MIKKLCNKIDSYGKQDRVVLIFLAIWLCINLIQSFFTELHPDEAYYWLYSQNLKWGYFDHPPVIAVLVKSGYFLFHNEFGVRFFLAIVGTGTIYIIYQIAREYLTSISLFILLLGSIVIVQSHIGGFLAIPDIPVVFFSSLFYLIYRKYLRKDSVYTALLLGVIIGLMFYSKYHALLVIVFTLLGNLSILKRKSFWIIPLLAIILLLPHLFWQIHNNFPTFEYHLVSRSSPYNVQYTFNYLFSQLLIAGPFIGVIVFYFSFKVPVADNTYLKVLKVNFWGFILFFLVMSFKGRVEAHWTAIAYIPGLILTMIGIQNSEKSKKWVRALFVPTLLVFFIIRGLLIDPTLIKNTSPGKDFYGWKKWANEIKDYAGNRKVVFVNSFQQPSKYSFYTDGDFSHVLNSIHYRKNQFDLWNGEDSIQGKDILLVGAYRVFDTLMTTKGPYRVRKIDDFHSYYDIKIIPDIKEFNVSPGDSVSIGLSIVNTREDSLKFISSDPLFPPKLAVLFNDKKKFLKNQGLNLIEGSIPPGGSFHKEISLKVPEDIGTYSCYVSIINDRLLPPFNSQPVIFHVE